MSSPAVCDLAPLKRLGRYLVLFPRCVSVFRWQEPPTSIDAFSDSDWGGDLVTRRSTSGGCILRGGHLLMHWSRTQQVVSLSSAEAELYGANRAAAESLGTQSFATDLGRCVRVRLHIDSSAALSLISRIGLGKAKHIEIQHLWLQEAVKKGRVSVQKVPTDINPADIGTKHLHAERISMLMGLMNCFYA